MSTDQYMNSLVFNKHNCSSNISIKDSLKSIKLIKSGTIIIRFRNYPKQGFMPLLSIANNQYPSSYLSLYIEHAQKIGAVKHIISKDKIISKHIDLHSIVVVDPKFINTVAISCVAGVKYTLYYNGQNVCEYYDNSASLFSDINDNGEIDKGILGEFYESQKIADKNYSYVGHFDFVHIHDVALDDKILKSITGQTKVEKSDNLGENFALQHIFYPGLNNSSNFRIPTLIKTSKGTLISSVDQREFGHQDHSNKVKTIIRRSTDDGQTFEDPITACEMFGNGQTIDSCLVEDKVNNRLFLLNNSHPDCLRPFTPKFGSGYISKGDELYHRLDFAGLVYYGDKNGQIFDNHWELTSYSFDGNYNLFKNSILIGNLFNSDSDIKVYQTTYTLICHSDDDGLTWSMPDILNNMIKQDYMKSLNVSPGVGIQIKNGNHKGRLCFPVYYYNEFGGGSSAIIYSDDYGKTFKLGDSANDGRIFNGTTLSSKTISHDSEFLTECQVIELPNGYLKLFIRNMNGFVAIATSKDGGQSFDPSVIIDKSLQDSFCQLSVIKLASKIDGKDSIAFSNPSSPARTDGTVKLGLLKFNTDLDDYDIDWAYSKLFKHGSFAYSCMAQINDNSIGIVYEGTPSTYLTFAKLSLDFIKSADMIPSVSYISKIMKDNLILSFDENVMLTGERVVNILQDDKEIKANLKNLDITSNDLTFCIEGIMTEADYSLSLSQGTELFSNLGVSIKL